MKHRSAALSPLNPWALGHGPAPALRARPGARAVIRADARGPVRGVSQGTPRLHAAARGPTHVRGLCPRAGGGAEHTVCGIGP